METPKIKVCGITRLDQALALEALGVDFLGFNFYLKSKRFIQPEDAAAIISQLKTARAVGIFVDAEENEVAYNAQITGIEALQLHGQEPESQLEALKNQTELPIIKAIPATAGMPNPEKSYSSSNYFLFDTASKGEFGGTGKAFDWKLLSGLGLKTPYFLAGGLGPDNLEQALLESNTPPFAVDLNSRVEDSPGIKNLKAVARCVEIVRNARG